MKPEIEYVYNKLKRLRFDFNSSDFRDFRSYYRYEPELMRYVRKDDNDLFIAKEAFKPLEDELEYADKCHSLEEQLGCPLEVRERALKQSNFEGLFVNTTDNDGFKWKGFEKCNLMYDAFNNRFYWCNGSFCIPLSDYKKRWWLKEDKSE
jgi:hypothetical protein